MRYLLASFGSSLRFLQNWRCLPLLALTLLCLLLEERFPFSNFPMYSSFTSRTFYVYLADGEDNPLATVTSGGMHTSKLKKIYQTELRKEQQRNARNRRLTPEEKRPAGKRVLTMLRKSPVMQAQGLEAPSVLRLYEVNISLSHGRFRKQSILIAEAP